MKNQKHSRLRLQAEWYRDFSIVVLCCLLFIIGITACISQKHRAQYVDRRNTQDCYALYKGSDELDSAFITQVGKDKDYFRSDDYIYFVDSVPHGTPFSQPAEIYVDERLLNYFVFVFTKENSDSILGYIVQSKPISEGTVIIRKNNISHIADVWVSDIYGFHNGNLVLKWRYFPMIRRR